MFYTGQKVVCVDDGHEDAFIRWYDGTKIVKGQTYTVRNTGTTVFGTPGIRLMEVELTGVNGYNTGLPFKDNLYKQSRFRPLVERKTDISVFTALLNPANHKELVDAKGP